jgi:2-C-methyl-D-erythritol 2,4-cyclodiphosphate synthase
LLRAGMGYDVHRLGPGRRLMLGGVEIPHPKGAVGHSDGDVLIHAVIDAMLGACALGDIGVHFPDDDPQYEGASGRDLLQRTAAKVGRLGRVVNIDSTVVAERPKLTMHIPGMRAIIAGVLSLDAERVSIKAKTAEGLGAVGRGEAIEAYAVALVDLDEGKAER